MAKAGVKSNLTAPLLDLEEGRNISQLQYVLKLAHSPELTDQQKAAIELSKMVEGSKFPAVSFGPLAHALCRLLPSENRTVAYHAARAVKVLLLDDALRGQALVLGIPGVLVSAMRAWEEEVPCLREILAGMQTLTWDKYAVTQVADAGAFPPLLALLKSRDQELCQQVTAVVANSLSFCDTVFLSRSDYINSMAEALPSIMELAKSRDRLQRCYATAALANASAHPVLAGKIKTLDGLSLVQQIELQNRRNLNFGGTRISECAETAAARLSGTGDARVALRKYSFKWGNPPVMELTLDSKRNRAKVAVCFVLWICLTYFLLKPVLGPGDREAKLAR